MHRFRHLAISRPSTALFQRAGVIVESLRSILHGQWLAVGSQKESARRKAQRDESPCACRVLAAKNWEWQLFFTGCQSFQTSTLPHYAVKIGHHTSVYYGKRNDIVKPLAKNREK